MNILYRVPPKVSIGLPVYNGAHYLERLLNLILDQSFTDFELIISDNASTDRTEEICRFYARQDQRVRYHRNQTNIGLIGNHNLVFKLATGQYFKWISIDDNFGLNYLRKCVSVLNQNSDVVACHCRVIHVEDGVSLNLVEDIYDDLLKPQERFYDVLLVKKNLDFFHGVIRTDALKKIGSIGNYYNSDRVYLAKLSLAGRLFELSDEMYFVEKARDNMRSIPDTGSRFVRPYLQHLYPYFYTVKNNPSHKGKPSFSRWSMLFDLISAVHQSPIPLRAKLHCYGHIGKWVKLWWKGGLMLDIVIAVMQMLGLFNQVLYGTETKLVQSKEVSSR